MADDTKKYVSQLANDMQVLESNATSLTRAFGDLGDASNKWWTILARLSSGSGLWKFQARLRSVSNLFELYYKAQDKALQNTLNSLDAAQKLTGAFERVENKYSMFSKNIGKITKKQKADDVFSVYMARLKDEEKAFYFTQKTYASAHKKFRRQMKKDNKKLKKQMRLPYSAKQFGGIFNRKGKINADGSEQKGTLRKGTILGDVAPMRAGRKALSMGKSAYGFFTKGGAEKSTLSERYGKADKRGVVYGAKKFKAEQARLKEANKFRKRMGRVAKSFKDKLMPALTAMSKAILQVVVKALMGFLIYLPLIIIVFMALRKAFGPVREWARKNEHLFIQIKEQIIELYYVMKELFRAIFDGDIIKVLKIWFTQVLPLVARILFNVAKVILTALAVIIHSVFKTFYDVLQNLWGAAKSYISKKLSFHASGGTVNTPLQIVGERGPELVSLPRGSQVYPNGMAVSGGGSTTINVHVNGRVGASDSEIKDIANKVAKEINLRMNRTGTTGTGF